MLFVMLKWVSLCFLLLLFLWWYCLILYFIAMYTLLYSRAGCLETCLGLDTRLQTRFWVSRSRYANASSRSRTLKVSENGHVSIETWKNFGFETAFRSLIRKQQWYLLDVFKVKHCAWFRTLQKHLASFCLDHFALLFRPAEFVGFCFLFMSSVYENWSISTTKHMHSMVIYSRPRMSNYLIY